MRTSQEKRKRRLLFIESICQTYEKHGWAMSIRRYFRFLHLPRLDWSFTRLVAHLLSTCMTIFSYDLYPKFIARAYSTGTTLLLTLKCLLAYIKRTMYKRSNTPNASFSSESEIFASYLKNVRKYKENRAIRFSRSREKLPTGRKLRNYTYGYATLSSEFHNYLRDVHNLIFTSWSSKFLAIELWMKLRFPQILSKSIDLYNRWSHSLMTRILILITIYIEW